MRINSNVFSNATTVVLPASGTPPILAPLTLVTLGQDACMCDSAVRLVVSDGRHRIYIDRLLGDDPTFVVGGAAGWQTVELLDQDEHVLVSRLFRVTCTTHIDDGGAGFGDLLRDMHLTMLTSSGGDGLGTVMFGGKVYRYFICWLRDHTHTLKGMKYFSDEVKTGLELYADTQRGDGMIYDRIAPKPDVQGWRDYTLSKGNFIRTLNAGTPNSYTLQRIPVENDVEFLFIECLYQTWRATGDNVWMEQYLDHAKRAVAYSTHDRYRWSEKFGLLKRGYTIDTWDFMHEDDTALTRGDNICDPDKTTFGIMHGDNTGMAASCRMLAEMLCAAGRAEEAPGYEQLADDLLRRLEQIAWDERGFYRHHVTENSSFHRDVGQTDESSQISLSNAYALNRGIGDDKCRAIINTYRRIRREMPTSSPGEFFNIYPPFDNGFDGPQARWQYMNGGVSTIVAGELARGAFLLNNDVYAIDILHRLKALADRHGGHLHVCFNGNPQTDPPVRSFTPLDLSDLAKVTASYRAIGGWGEPGNDLSQMPTGDFTYRHVPFRICDDGRGLGVAHDKPGYQREIRVPVNGKHACLYLLHTVSHPASPIAELDVIYADGQHHRIYLSPGQQLDSWFMPGSGESRHAEQHGNGGPKYQLAWRGGNDTFDNVGIFVWGWNNPRPDIAIESLVFRAAENNSVYFVPGITFSDQPIWFPQSDLSFGIPDAWGAAAVVYALIEGLAGVVDDSQMFNAVHLSPRWIAADVHTAEVAVTYPASDGYVAYRHHHDARAKQLHLMFTGSGDAFHCDLPLPRTACGVVGVTLNAHAIEYETRRVDDAISVQLKHTAVGPHLLVVSYC